MTNKQKKLIGNIAFYLGNTVVALIFVSPLIWMIMASLKPEAEIFAGMNTLKTFIASNPSLDNYAQVFERINMLKYILNSLFYVFVIVILDLLINSICGYADRKSVV